MFSTNKSTKIVAVRGESKFVRTLHNIWIIAQRNILLYIRNPVVTLISFVLPTLLMLMFTAGFAKVVTPGSGYAEYAQFVVPFCIVQGLLMNAVNVGSAFYDDLHSGMDMRLRIMPIARLSCIGGRLIAAANNFFFQVAGVVLVGYIIGFRFQGGLRGILGFFFIPIIFTTSFTLIAMYIAIKVKDAESISLTMNPWVFPLTFLSTGYVPQESFPLWIQGFVRVNPVSVEVQAMRAFATGNSALSYSLIVFGCSLSLILIFGTLTVKAYTKIMERSGG